MIAGAAIAAVISAPSQCTGRNRDRQQAADPRSRQALHLLPRFDLRGGASATGFNAACTALVRRENRTGSKGGDRRRYPHHEVFSSDGPGKGSASPFFRIAPDAAYANLANSNY
jgi:hypothetical protein